MENLQRHGIHGQPLCVCAQWSPSRSQTHRSRKAVVLITYDQDLATVNQGSSRAWNQERKGERKGQNKSRKEKQKEVACHKQPFPFEQQQQYNKILALENNCKGLLFSHVYFFY